MKVPFLDLRRGGEALDDALRATFDRVLRSGRYIMGPEVEAFEAACASYLGVAHAIGVSSGTDALLATFMAFDIGPGDEVIVPSYTFFATAGAVARLGATPVFVDISPTDFNASAETIGAAITTRTKLIVPVHLFGQCADMRGIAAVAGDIPIVEDAAQAIGADLHGVRAGGLGASACFSFFPAKNLGGFGDAGLITTDDETLAARIRRLRVHGSGPKYHHTMVGGNFRIDSLQAALLGVKLQHLERTTRLRREHAAAYREQLGDLVRVPVEVAGRRHVYNQFVVRTDRRDDLQASLREHGVGTAIYYPRALHQQPCFAGLESAPLPESERMCQECLALPVFPELTVRERDHVVETIRSFFAGRA